MKYIIPIVLVVASSVRAEYPVNFPKCLNGDGACLTDAANGVIQKYSSGLRDTSINLLPIEPLHIITMILERNPMSAVKIELKLSDVEVFGFKSMKVTELNGFSADLSGRNVLKGTVPELRFKGQHNINGTIFVLPVVGDGPFEIQMENVQVTFEFDFKPVKKNGQTYAALEHIKLMLKPHHIHFQFDNLFDGNQLLGDSMNRFINDNWHEFYDEFKQGSTRALGLVVKSVINSFFEKYPYNKYFL